MPEYKLKPNQNYQAKTSVAPVVRVFKLGEEPKDNTYWLSRLPLERIAMIERLRREVYGEYELECNPETIFGGGTLRLALR